MLAHFLEHPDPNGFKAQLVAVDRKAKAPVRELMLVADIDDQRFAP